MKKILYTLSLCLALAVALVQPAWAEDSPPPNHILIIAIQTGLTGAAGSDFVEIYNPTPDTINVTGWKLQYRSATAIGSVTWSTKRTVACPVGSAADCAVELPSGGRLIFSTYDLPSIEGEQPMTTGLSDMGGQLRILQPAFDALLQTVHDVVGYGTAAEAEGGLAAPAPLPDETIVRFMNETMTLIDTDVNTNDFYILGAACYAPGGSTDAPIVNLCIVPTVPDDPAPPVEPAPTPAPIPIPAPTPTSSPVNPSYKPLLINELLPDPAMPQTDGEYEFIELYNPNEVAVNAAGYVLQAGSEYRYEYVLGAMTIPAGGYVAITSAESHLSLSNSGTAVRLSAPNGTVLDEVASYGDAKVGQSWAKSGTGWAWSVRPTPGATNRSLASTLPPKSNGVGAVKRSDAAYSAGAFSQGLKGQGGGGQGEQAQTAVDLLSPWFLAPVGALVASYGAFEYRKDLARFGRKLKSLFIKGKDGGTTPQMG